MTLALLNFVFFILGAILSLLWWAIILHAVLSWLVAFDVINLRNRFIYSVAHMLEAVTRPLLEPLRRIIPSLGGVDITPIIALLAITGVQRYILPSAHAALASLIA